VSRKDFNKQRVSPKEYKRNYMQGGNPKRKLRKDFNMQRVSPTNKRRAKEIIGEEIILNEKEQKESETKR
jgi:hypothetical protein